MIFIGIDIGVTGAAGMLSSSGDCAVCSLPVLKDTDAGTRIAGRQLLDVLRNWVPPHEYGLVLIEDVRPRPMGNKGAHGNTMFSQGSMMRTRGAIEAAVDIAGLRLEVVQPQTWKRSYGLIKAEKSASLELARRLFPPLKPALARVLDHNRAEALLLARYAMREYA